MQTAYVFHAKSCALLLDDGGICRWIVMKNDADDPQSAARAQRCVGAQFVATLDPEREGLLGHEPAVGKHVLFARNDDGRISLVRFGPILQVDRVEEPAPETRRVESPAESEAATIERPAPAVALQLDDLEAEDVVTSVAVEPIDGSENATAPFERSEPTLPSSPSLPRLRVRATRGILPSRSRLN